MDIYKDIAHHQPDHSDGPGEISPVADLSLTAECSIAYLASKVHDAGESKCIL